MELLSPGYLDDNDFIDIYKTWKSSKDVYGCNVHNKKYHEKMQCVKGGCTKCILGSDNKEKFILNMENRLGEYLNEGGKDVSEFKVGDRVKCISVSGVTKRWNSDNIFVGVEYTLTHVFDDGKMGIDGFSQCVEKCDFKLTTKTQTTKENNMNINSSIRTVLVEENKETFETVEKFQKVFGAEIAENFTGAMILRKNIKAYNDEIKRLDDIEAKRLEKEEKDK
jgi:hypothetical protein